MTKGNIVRAVQGLLCILMAVWCGLGALGIYREGAERKAEHPLEAVYTPEAAAAALRPLVPLACLSLGLTAAGLLLFPEDKAALRLARDAEISRSALAAHTARPSREMEKERAVQRLWTVFGWAAFGGCMIPPALYLLDGTHFPEGELESMIGSLAGVLIPWTAAGLCCLLTAGFLRERSFRREAEAAKRQRGEEKRAGIENQPAGERRPARYGPWQAALIALAAAWIVTGICNGSALDVLYKAINICTECIGLG